MDILFTIASSIIIFLFCEGILRIVYINPYLEYVKLKSKTAYTLTYYSNIYTNPEYIGDGVTLPDEYKQARLELRKTAAELRAYIELKPKTRIGVPKKEKIYEATEELIGLSNGLNTPYNSHEDSNIADNNLRRCSKICYLLNIYIKK